MNKIKNNVKTHWECIFFILIFAIIVTKLLKSSRVPEPLPVPEPLTSSQPVHEVKISGTGKDLTIATTNDFIIQYASAGWNDMDTIKKKEAINYAKPAYDILEQLYNKYRYENTPSVDATTIIKLYNDCLYKTYYNSLYGLCYNITPTQLNGFNDRLQEINTLNSQLDGKTYQVDLQNIRDLVNSVNICSDTSCNMKFAKSVLTNGKCTCPSGSSIDNNECKSTCTIS
jgi:hypothetical protein